MLRILWIGENERFLKTEPCLIFISCRDRIQNLMAKNLVVRTPGINLKN